MWIISPDFLKAEISLSGFWSKSFLDNRGIIGGFFGGFFPACFPMENGPKTSTKKSPRKPNTKIHQKFQGRGIPDDPGRETGVESCHVSGCHGFSGPDESMFSRNMLLKVAHVSLLTYDTIADTSIST